MATTVLYPAAGPPGAAPTPNAPPAAAGRPYPLLVFAHGFDATPTLYASLLSFVGQEPPKLRQAHIGNGTGQLAVLEHARDAQILDADYGGPLLCWLGFCHQGSGCFVQGIFTDMSHLGMHASQFLLGFFTVG